MLNATSAWVKFPGVTGSALDVAVLERVSGDIAASPLHMGKDLETLARYVSLGVVPSSQHHSPASVRYPDTTRFTAVSAHSAANAQAIVANCAGNRHISANAMIVSVPSASPSR